MRKKDLSKREYDRLHKRIFIRYGPASKCESETCSSKNPKRFEWALKKGRQYSDDPDDYLQLCPSCHRKYDFTEEYREKLSMANRGQNSHKTKLKDKDVLDIYDLMNGGVTNKEIAAMYGMDSSSISNIRTGKHWPHLYHHFTPKNNAYAEGK